jgi:hypothetical protein
MKFRVFGDVTPCSQVDADRSFRSSPWWWRQYAPLKSWSTSTWLHGAISQKTLNFGFNSVGTIAKTGECCVIDHIFWCYPKRISNHVAVSRRWNTATLTLWNGGQATMCLVSRTFSRDYKQLHVLFHVMQPVKFYRQTGSIIIINVLEQIPPGEAGSFLADQEIWPRTRRTAGRYKFWNSIFWDIW